RAPGAPVGSWRARLGATALVSPCALVGTAPLTAFHFHQVSLVGLVANPLTIPIFGSAVVVVGLVGAVAEPVLPGAAAVLFRLAGGRAASRHRARPGAGAAGVGGRRRADPEPARAGARLRAPRRAPRAAATRGAGPRRPGARWSRCGRDLVDARAVLRRAP